MVTQRTVPSTQSGKMGERLPYAVPYYPDSWAADNNERKVLERYVQFGSSPVRIIDMRESHDSGGIIIDYLELMRSLYG